MTVNYNLAGLNTTVLKLDGPVLADIYAGRIRAWDDKAIAFINPDINLPHHDIIPVHRADGSGRYLRVHPIPNIQHNPAAVGEGRRLWQLG
jgi:ABC-type phosphate transport system substrate-binding protein